MHYFKKNFTGYKPRSRLKRGKEEGGNFREGIVRRGGEGMEVERVWNGGKVAS
jgi:hypothetical protein